MTNLHQSGKIHNLHQVGNVSGYVDLKGPASRTFVLSGAKAQIARSPSKKRASFNTGRGKERVRTSSDTDKHVNRVTDVNKSFANKVTLSPSLDAGLASKDRINCIL